MAAANSRLVRLLILLMLDRAGSFLSLSRVEGAPVGEGGEGRRGRREREEGEGGGREERERK